MAPGTTATVTAAAGGLEISDGNSQWGGGIYNSGALTLSACTIADNQAIGAHGAGCRWRRDLQRPGAILNLSDGTYIVNNTAQGGPVPRAATGWGAAFPAKRAPMAQRR